MLVPPVFEVIDLSYDYSNQIPALDHVSLTVLPGERLAILGSNGSGKSTLLKILDGLYFPTHGSVSAFGKPLTEQSFQEDIFNFEFRRRIGLVFQDSDVQLFMPSVWDEVAFAPLQMGISQEDVKERVASALASLEIEKLSDRPPHQLSNGEKKRVALASVLSLSPEIWLLDEPTSGLDPRSQGWLEDFILNQRHVGNTLIIATHDLAFAEQIATRVLLLDEDHSIAASGDPREILGNHELLHRCNLSHFHAPASE